MTERTPTITCHHLLQATVPPTTRMLPTQGPTIRSLQVLLRSGRPTRQPTTQVPTQGTTLRHQCPMECHRPQLTDSHHLSSHNSSSTGKISPSSSRITATSITEGAVADTTVEATITTIAEVPTKTKEVAIDHHNSIRTPTVVGKGTQETIKSMISGIGSQSSPRISGRPSSLGITTLSRERSQRRRSRRGAGSSCGRRSYVTPSEGVAPSLRLTFSTRRAGMMPWWRPQAPTHSS